MPPDPALNPAAILSALGITDATAITPVHGGTDTALWRVEHRSLTYALRVFRSEQADTYQRELAALEAARQAHLPVPAIHATSLWHERPALLVSWCPGIPLGEALRQRPWRVGALGMAFGRTQARIHQVSAPAGLDQQRSDWITWAGSDERSLQALLQRAAGNAAVLIHLDYHPLNVLTDGTQITAILDWANARAGDPRADVARTYTILMVEPYGPGRQSLTLSLGRRLLAWSWQHGYAQVAGRLGEMALFYAWAGAVMVRDLAPRVTNPQSWWQEHHLEHIREWTIKWKQRADRFV
jgi:aminoglycoside phosphotransferase (APT) family kinase protein